MKPLREVAIVFVFAMLAIWCPKIFQPANYYLAVLPISLVLLYWRDNPDSWKNLWRPEGKQKDYILLYFSLLIFWRAITLTGELHNPEIIFQPHLIKNFSISLLCYIPNALWQQVLVNGYFLPRLKEGIWNETKVICLLGVMFALVHLPNPVLMPITLIGGMLSAHFFQKTKNIYALTLAHAALAVSAMYFFPESWHHHLTVGPGYYAWKP